MKTCAKCLASKPVDEFQDRPKSKQGKRATCRICTNAIQQNWARSNKGKRRASTLKWKKANPETVRAGYRQRRLNDPERQRQRDRQRYARHAERKAAGAQARRDRDRSAYNEMVRLRRLADPTKHRAANANRRGRELGKITPTDIKTQFQSQGGCCYYCRVDVRKAYHVDHFVALAAGGAHAPDNIVIACRRCNLKKNKFEAFAFFKKLGIEVEPLRMVA